MSIALSGYALTGFAVSAAIAADYFIKIASQKEAALMTPSFGMGAALYVVSACAWLYAMKIMTLAQVGVLYSVVTILALAAMGVFLFEESFTWRDAAGVFFALLAVAFMGRFL